MMFSSVWNIFFTRQPAPSHFNHPPPNPNECSAWMAPSKSLLRTRSEKRGPGQDSCSLGMPPNASQTSGSPCTPCPPLTCKILTCVNDPHPWMALFGVQKIQSAGHLGNIFVYMYRNVWGCGCVYGYCIFHCIHCISPPHRFRQHPWTASGLSSKDFRCISMPHYHVPFPKASDGLSLWPLFLGRGRGLTGSAAADKVGELRASLDRNVNALKEQLARLANRKGRGGSWTLSLFPSQR